MAYFDWGWQQEHRGDPVVESSDWLVYQNRHLRMRKQCENSATTTQRYKQWYQWPQSRNNTTKHWKIKAEHESNMWGREKKKMNCSRSETKLDIESLIPYWNPAESIVSQSRGLKLRTHLGRGSGAGAAVVHLPEGAEPRNGHCGFEHMKLRDNRSASW